MDKLYIIDNQYYIIYKRKTFQNFPQWIVDFRRNLEKNGNFWSGKESYQQKNDPKVVVLSTGQC